MSKIIEIPFDATGNQQHYPEDTFYTDSIGKWQRVEPTFTTNFEFYDTLTYVGFQRGRSAAYFIFQRENGKKVTMFMTDLDSSIHKMKLGQLTGKFTFCKRGANFGVKFLGE